MEIKASAMLSPSKPIPKVGSRTHLDEMYGPTSPLLYDNGLLKRDEIVSSLPPRTKIICTLGPASRSKPMLKDLLLTGMSVARLNFSHGDHEYHAGTIAMIREVVAETHRLCAVLLDTKGPEIRTGKLKDDKDVPLVKGQKFSLFTDVSVLGDSTRVGVAYANLGKVLKPGNIVLIDDGLISMTVESIKPGVDGAPTEVLCEVNNNGTLGGTKGVNLPGVTVDLPAITEKDVRDIKFGVAQGVDFVAASFVRKVRRRGAAPRGRNACLAGRGRSRVP